MQAIIKPSVLQGAIDVPPSKSMMQRVCACALLHKGKTFIANPGYSNDDKAAINIIEDLGATVEYTEQNTIIINSHTTTEINTKIDCGESGLSARLFTPIAALQNKQITITGTGSLLQRPMTEYVALLPQLGVLVQSNNNQLPLTVTGPLQPKDITLDGSMSSQFLSGLLISFAFAAKEEVTINVTNLNSKPYIDLTLHVLKNFGRQITNNNYQSFTITPTVFGEVPDVYINIEADWSAAANFIVAKAMGADIDINHLSNDSLQADTAINSVITDSKDAFHFDATNCPDLFPILAIYAAYCNGESSICGLNRLIHKESNRIISISEMLNHFGVSFRIEGDTLTISGGNGFKACTIDAHNDHRIVMAAAIAALHADGMVTINGAQAVNKSYPDFFDTLQSAGVDCQLVN